MANVSNDNYDIKLLLVTGYTRVHCMEHKVPDDIGEIITRFYVIAHMFGTREWIFRPHIENGNINKKRIELVYQSIMMNNEEKCFEELRFEDQYQYQNISSSNKANVRLSPHKYSSIPPKLEPTNNATKAPQSSTCTNCRSLGEQFKKYKITAQKTIDELSEKLKDQQQIYKDMQQHNQSMNKLLCDKIKELQIQLDTHKVNVRSNATNTDQMKQKQVINPTVKHIDFKSMNLLRSELINALDKINYIFPSKIQHEAISKCLSDKRYPNLIAQAHHGSGKTAAFILIMLQRIDESICALQGAVVVHSRELAMQTFNAFEAMGQYIDGLYIALAIKGEMWINTWYEQICVGTPGTIMHHVINTQKRKPFHRFIKHFKVLVIDEADEFLLQCVSSAPAKRRRKRYNICTLYDQLIRIISDIMNYKSDVQTLLFSATYPLRVKKLAAQIAPNAVVIKVEKEKIQLENIKIFNISCEEKDKLDILLKIVSVSNIGQMIIFVNTVKSAEMLVKELEKENVGIACSVLYGKGMNVSYRDKTMCEFRKGQTQCLVASNVIARGIDVPAVGLVVNFDISNADVFVHRVGRTGRFGAKGVCINLVSKNDFSNQRLITIKKEYSLHMIELSDDIKTIKDYVSGWLQNRF